MHEIVKMLIKTIDTTIQELKVIIFDFVILLLLKIC